MKLVLVLLFIFANLTAEALPLRPCEGLLAAQPIDRTPQRYYPIEMGAAGTIILPDSPLPALDIGFYVYLVTANGEIMLAHKYNWRGGMKTLATHKSLLELFRRQFPEADEPDIVAAGEFQMAFDEVVEIRNKSGNFRGDTPTLNLAVDVFALHRLPITPRTKITPVNPGEPEDLGHTPADRTQDSYRLMMMTQLNATARGRMLLDIYRRMYSLLGETFPGVHGIDLIRKMMDAQGAGALISGEYDGYQTVTYPLLSAYTSDGIDYGIWISESLPDRGAENGFSTGAPRQIQNFIQGAEHQLNPRLRTKWERLSREFQRLDSLN